MNVSPVNFTSIQETKPNYTLKNAEFEKLIVKTDNLQDEYMKSDDIKTPVQVGVAVAGAVAAAIGIAKAGSAAISKAAPGLANKIGSKAEAVTSKIAQKGGKLGEKAAEKLPSNVVATVKKAGTSLKSGVSKIVNKGVQEPTTAEFAAHLNQSIKSESFKTVEEISQFAEKELNNVVNGIANKRMQNIAGAGAGIGTLAYVTKKDGDGDGVKDIMQKSQNVYTGTKKVYNGINNAASTVSDIVSIFT